MPRSHMEKHSAQQELHNIALSVCYAKQGIDVPVTNFTNLIPVCSVAEVRSFTSRQHNWFHSMSQHITCLTPDRMPSAQVQAALKSKGLRDDITVLVIDAMPDDSFRLPPFLAKQNGGYAVTLEDVGSVDWHKPLDEAAAADACASNTW